MGKNHHRIQVLISGSVQGVFFRQKTKEEAEKLGVAGWVKNEEDGKVMILAEGEKEKIKKLLKWAKSGPRLARVEAVDIEWQRPKGLIGFKIRY